MIADAKLKTLTTGLYSNVNDQVRVLFCYGYSTKMRGIITTAISYALKTR